MNPSGLLSAIQQRTEVPADTVRTVYDAMIQIMRGALIDGHAITLRDLCTLVPTTRPSRTNVHPTLGKRDLPPGRRIKFILAPAMREELREG